MIKHPDQFIGEIRKNARGGEGEVLFSAFWKPGTEMKSNTRMYSKLVLEPGTSIGSHMHENEEEIFYVLKGTAETLDNGTVAVLHPGDSSITGNGETHYLKNIGNETLEVLAVILKY